MTFCALPSTASPVGEVGAALIAVNWGCTGLVSVPLHGRLSARRDPRALRALVWTNWIRTAAWTGRGALLFVLLQLALAG